MPGWRVLVLVALVLGLLAPVRAEAVAEHAVDGLELVSRDQIADRVHAFTFRSSALPGIETGVRVIVPEGYDPSGVTRYPVLYLLHGAAGNSLSWLEASRVEEITAGYPVITVFPDGGYFGFYTDWWNFGLPGGPRWETYHLGQLVPWIDANLPTVGTRDGRAVGGLSMGGLGAMHYAAKRPDLFTAAASFSGAVDTNVFVAPPVVEALTTLEATHLPAAAFGPRATEEIRWRGHNPVDLAENLRGLLVTLDTGTGEPGDPVEMAMHQMNAPMHDALDHFGVEHQWRSTPGCHCWYLWEQHLAKVLPGIMERFAHPVALPSPFTYKSIDARYRMHGWDVAIDRPALEWSRLFDAGPSGFGLTGSGAARVTTAAMFEPGQRVPVSITDAGGTHATELAADAAGRLQVALSLGPGNPFQQHSPAGTVWALAQGLPAGEWPTATARVTFG